MSQAIPGTAVSSSNPSTSTNTSLTVNLATTTVGAYNFVKIAGYATGTAINPVMATPTGWTKVFEVITPTGSPAAYAALFIRKVASGDGATQLFTWTNAGQMTASTTPWFGADATNPVPWFQTTIKSGSTTTYTATGTTGIQGVFCYGSANRTGTTYTVTTDNDDGAVGISSGAVQVNRCSTNEYPAGIPVTKTMTGSSTSIGVSWEYQVLSAAPVQMVYAAFMARTAAQRVVAHRCGDNDDVEMTFHAANTAIAYCSYIPLNIDVVRCSTGEFVCSHDTTTGRVFGTNYTIATTPWSTLSTLTTTVGGYPIQKVEDFLTSYSNQHFWIENKGSSADDAALFSLLIPYNTNGRILIKAYYTASTVVTDAHNNGFPVWQYYFTADVANIASTQASGDFLGLDYTDTTPADWTNIKSYGKLVFAHVIPSVAGATQAYSEGADGLMSGKVIGVAQSTATPASYGWGLRLV